VKLKELFDYQYKNWDISLPERDVQQRKKGSILKNGWMIKYRFGWDKGIEYLEYFVSHRMTNDTLYRIYEDGDNELVGCARDFYLADDEKDKRAFIEHNRQFYDEVKQRGLF
jgi:hypothetical protein